MSIARYCKRSRASGDATPNAASLFASGQSNAGAGGIDLSAKQGFQSGFPGFEKNSAKTAVSLKRARIPNSRACIAPACDGGSGRRSSACESKKLVHDWCSTVKPVELELRSGLGERT